MTTCPKCGHRFENPIALAGGKATGGAKAEAARRNLAKGRQSRLDKLAAQKAAKG